MKSKNSSMVSVIIPTLNNGLTIASCLDSVRKQTFDNVEIIVVDSKSSDDTVRIAKKFADKIIVSPDSQIADARNIGIQSSKGKYICSIDSDMELSPSVIEECISQSKTFDAVIIPEISIGTGFWSRCKAFERSFYIRDPMIEAPRFFTKEILNAINYYDPKLCLGEDWDIKNKLASKNIAIGRIDSIIRHNEGSLTLGKLWNKKIKYGATFKDYIQKYPELAAKQVSIFRPAFVKLGNIPKFLGHPVLSLGLFIMKSIEYVAFSLGRWQSR